MAQCLRKFFLLSEKTLFLVEEKNEPFNHSEGLKNLKNAAVCKKNVASVIINEKYVLHLPVHWKTVYSKNKKINKKYGS